MGSRRGGPGFVYTPMILTNLDQSIHVVKSMGSTIFQNNQLGDSSLHKMRVYTVQRKIFEKSLSGIAVHLLADKL